MSEGASTADEQVAALRAEFAEFKQALEDLKQARTPAEKQEAREEVRDAEADLDKLAARLGIPRAQLDRAKEEAKYAELKPFIERYLNELPDDDEEGKGEKDGGEKPAKEPKADKSAKEKPAKESDTGPVVPHWSERRLSEIIK